MSCCCRKQKEYKPVCVPQYGTGSNCICSFPTLVILILIILQFSKTTRHDYHDEDC